MTRPFVTVVPDNPDIRLINVHPMDDCSHRNCVIHNPSDHTLRSWPLHWRQDRYLFERVCEHGVGHPDPDQFEHWAESGQDEQAMHGCDGCCELEIEIVWEPEEA